MEILYLLTAVSVLSQLTTSKLRFIPLNTETGGDIYCVQGVCDNQYTQILGSQISITSGFLYTIPGNQQPDNQTILFEGRPTDTNTMDYSVVAMSYTDFQSDYYNKTIFLCPDINLYDSTSCTTSLYFDNSTCDFPTISPTRISTVNPSTTPTTQPASIPTEIPSETPTADPTVVPTANPSTTPTMQPTSMPTEIPSETPTADPSAVPTASPSTTPTTQPTWMPTENPSYLPTEDPTAIPTANPSATPTKIPTRQPTSARPTASTRTLKPVVFMSSDNFICPTLAPSNVPKPTFTHDDDSTQHFTHAKNHVHAETSSTLSSYSIITGACIATALSMAGFFAIRSCFSSNHCNTMEEKNELTKKLLLRT